MSALGETRVRNDYNSKADINENEFAVLILSEDGMIRDCNKQGENLLGGSSKRLSKLHISQLLPKLAKIDLLKEKRASPYLRFLSRIGHPFEVVSLSGVHFAGRLFFSDIENCGLHQLVVMIHPVYQKNTLH